MKPAGLEPSPLALALAPCPYCGCTPSLYRLGNHWRVRCRIGQDSCGAATPLADLQAAARLFWNTGNVRPGRGVAA